MFRDRLHGRNALIVLDNAVGVDQVRDLIPASRTCLVLITSRRSLAGLDNASTYVLDVFDPADAVALLARIAGSERVEAERPTAEEIVALCGHLPLAVSLVAARLRSRPTWRLTDVAERLRAGGPDALMVGSSRLQAVFEVSYRGLPDEARRLFRLLGLLPSADFTAHAAAALAGIGDEDARHLLELLQDEHLLQGTASDRFQFHDLIREYAAGVARREEAATDRSAAKKRLLTWYLHAAVAAMDVIAPQRRPVPLSRTASPGTLPAFVDGPSAYTWCDTELSTLVEMVSLAHQLAADDIAWQLPVTSQYYFDQRFLLEAFIATHTVGIESARQAQSSEGEARILLGLSSAYRLAGRFPEAIDAAQSMRSLSRRTADHRGEASAMSTLALIHRDMGDHEEAARWSLRQVEIGRLSEDRLLLASSLNNLGRSYRELGRFDEARRSVQEAIEVNSDIGNADWLGYAVDSMGEVLAAQGDHVQAVDHFRRAVHLFHGTGNELSEAESLEHLGSCQEAVGHLSEARDSLTRAYDIVTG